MPVGRLEVDLARGADLRNAAGFHDDDAIGQRHRFFLVVRHINRRDAETAQQAVHLCTHGLAQLGVERRKRFVEQQHARFGCQRTRQGHALALPARKLGHTAIRIRREVHHLQQRVSPGADLRVGQTVLPALDAQAVFDVAAHAQVREQRVALKHHADAAALDRARGDVFVAKVHGAAGIRRFQPRNDAQRGRLATARGAEQHDSLAGSNVEVHRLQHALAAKVFSAATQPDGHGREM